MDLFWDFNSRAKIIEKPLGVITSGTQNMGNGVYLLKAGTPISNAGAVANSGSAKYLVAEDFYFYSNSPSQPKLVKLIEKGYVDLAKAQAAAGITIKAAAKSALETAGITLVDGNLAYAKPSDIPEIPEIPVAANQADSTAETVAGLVTDFNGLLAKLKTAGIMEADAPAEDSSGEGE